MPQKNKLEALRRTAIEKGATDAAVISTKHIVVENFLSDLCLNPRCENFGLSGSCPPYVSGPEGFRKKAADFQQAIFFRIDVPSDILFSSDRREIFQLLHETAAGVERAAVEMGFKEARAFAGGSCKDIFCHQYAECLVVSKKGKCRNPEHARPSMSGYGINVTKLFEASGWELNRAIRDKDSTAPRIANVCGMVLINMSESCTLES